MPAITRVPLLDNWDHYASVTNIANILVTELTT
jgi:hypothetical protein